MLAIALYECISRDHYSTQHSETVLFLSINNICDHISNQMSTEGIIIEAVEVVEIGTIKSEDEN